MLRHRPNLGMDALEVGFQAWRARQKDFATCYRSSNLQQIIRQYQGQPIAPDHGGILISFHYGPYRLLPRWLLGMGYSLTLLTSEKVVMRKQEWYRGEVQQSTVRPDAFECIVADRPMVFKQLLSAVRRGRWVLVFLDADEGVGAEAALDHARLMQIRLFDGFLQWRSNILKIAHRFGLPVCLAYMGYRGDRSGWEPVLGQTVPCIQDEAERDFVERARLALEASFSDMMADDWLAWENWSFLHKYQKQISKPPLSTASHFLSVIPLRLAGRPYMFDIRESRFYEVRVRT